MKRGFVYLAGAGPGDPELVTLKAMRVMAEADCIIYDYLANASLLDRFNCEKIYAGKQGASHAIPQDGINSLIIDKAKEGKTVVRLKGGDPFIFGRGGEEAEELIEAGIPFAVIPGISSFYSAPAYAGIPVTHRDFANALELITGHRKPGGEDVNFPEYNPEKTYIFLMGMQNIPHIAKSLIEVKNFPPATPAAVITWGTRPEQKTVTGTLDSIAAIVEKNGMRPPAVIVVGHVVSLREKLRWFDSQPLFGKTIIVTRSRSQASEMSAKLTALGAAVAEFPTIEIKKKDAAPLLSAIDKLDTYKWIVFTSQNAVNIFFDTLFASKRDARALGALRIAVIGRATGSELLKYGLRPDIVPQKFVAESLAESMLPLIKQGDRVLLPCSEEARPFLADELKKSGAGVDRIHIYSSRPPEHVDGEMMELVKNADCVTFASSSTAKNFFAIVPQINGICASIGPVTTETLAALGHNPAVTADVFTINGLIEKLAGHYSKETNT
ncbi:MAG: uroporphyrinogen-III C-methyltransferase [Spirochaetia bacterium]|jgi:uroporphyrinogen III methyltransferase/synthase|nr:uroporphyrinogen-III C-methyltransferase [Spirochaetia bacterium]